MNFVLLCVVYLTVLPVLQMAEKTTSVSDKQLCEQDITEKRSGKGDGVNCFQTDIVQMECVDSESKPGAENAPDASCVEHCQRAEPDCVNTAEHVDETISKFSECNDHPTTNEVPHISGENSRPETADSDFGNSAGVGDKRNVQQETVDSDFGNSAGVGDKRNVQHETVDSDFVDSAGGGGDERNVQHETVDSDFVDSAGGGGDERNVQHKTVDSDFVDSAGGGGERNDCNSKSEALDRLKSAQTYDKAEDSQEGEAYDGDTAYWEAYWADFDEARKKYEFFWQSDNIYSQWHHSGFTVDGRKFSCAEQYMMYGKAVLFKDFYTARMVLQSKKPRDMKALGRKVQDFDPDIWMLYCLYIVKEANIAKFSQNEELRTAILATYPKVLVEASPRDQIWGIGLTEDDPGAWDERTWQGTNFLGYVLTEVRDELLFKAGLISEQKPRHIERLLRQASMSEETIKDINPEGWKPSPEEQQELNKRHQDDNREYKGNRHGKSHQDHDNGAHGKRAEKHTTQDDHVEDSAKMRRTEGDYHDDQGHRPKPGQNMSGHENRGQNRQDGSRAEAGYEGDNDRDYHRGQRSYGQGNRDHNSELEGHEDSGYQHQSGSRAEASYGSARNRDYHRGQRSHGQGNRADTDNNWRGHNNTQSTGRGRGRGRGGGNARRDYERHASHGEPEDYSEKDQYEYFWGQDNFYSQWYPTEFTARGKNFSCAEQYMMYMKAVLFEDQETASAILRTKDPNRMKKLGREVKGFNDETWQLHSLKFVKEGNLAKFSANQKLQRVLFRTHPKILVEASPFDRIWGIGLEATDEQAWRKATWKGSNFLGYILTEVRDELMAQQGHFNESERQIYLPDLQKQYALTLKNNRVPRDSKTGWEQYDKKEWRAQPVQNSNDPPTSMTYARHPEKQQSPSSVQHHDYFMGNKIDDKPDASGAQTKHPTIPGLTYASDANAKHPHIPGLPVDERKKKKKNKGKKNKEESSKTPNDWTENSDPDNFQIPDAMMSGEQTGEDVRKDDGEWKEVKGKNKSGHGKHETPKAQEHQEAHTKKGKRQSSPDKADANIAKDSKHGGTSKKSIDSSDIESLAGSLSIEDKAEEEDPTIAAKGKGGDGTQEQLSQRQRKNQRRKNRK